MMNRPPAARHPFVPPRGLGLVLGKASREESARFENLVLGLGVAGGLGDESSSDKPALRRSLLARKLGVAAQHDVRAAAGHVRGDGHGAELAGLRDDLGFLLVVLGVQHLCGMPSRLRSRDEMFALLDGDRTDQNGLALGVARLDLLDDGAVLAASVL